MKDPFRTKQRAAKQEQLSCLFGVSNVTLFYLNLPFILLCIILDIDKHLHLHMKAMG